MEISVAEFKDFGERRDGLLVHIGAKLENGETVSLLIPYQQVPPLQVALQGATEMAASARIKRFGPANDITLARNPFKIENYEVKLGWNIQEKRYHVMLLLKIGVGTTLDLVLDATQSKELGDSLIAGSRMAASELPPGQAH